MPPEPEQPETKCPRTFTIPGEGNGELNCVLPVDHGGPHRCSIDGIYDGMTNARASIEWVLGRA